jgi:hypothetical protein
MRAKTEHDGLAQALMVITRLPFDPEYQGSNLIKR